MYEIERTETGVVIRQKGQPIYKVSLDSYVVYQSGSDRLVAKVKDLTDEKLLLALANAVEIKV